MKRVGLWATAEAVTVGKDLSGRHAIVTGANTGIGFETARVLALRGCSVTLGCRNLATAEAARGRIARQNGADVRVQQLDLGSLASVHRFAAEFLATGRPLQLLINNAGVALMERRVTEDGFEAHFGINQIGHFVLTRLLLDRLCESAPARVVAVSSHAQHWATLTAGLADLNWEKRPFNGFKAYGDSKLMNVLFTNELNRRLEGTGVVANAVHPGLVRTELSRNSPTWMSIVLGPVLFFAKGPARGATTVVYAATDPELGQRGGGYYASCRPARTAKLGGDRAVQERFWKLSEELTGLGPAD